MITGYRAASELSGDRLDLHTALGATPEGVVENPQLFHGFLTRPDVAAAGLLAVADVAGSTYADFGLAKRLANLDPVVTASGDRLRFESFSGCNGVHARFDLLPDGIDSGEARFGTTNIDVNQPLRSALSTVDRDALLHVSVGTDELRVSTPSASFVEREVDLPERWVRGLAETPLLAEALRPVAELHGAAISRFLTSLPRTTGPGADLHLAAGRATLTTRLDAGPSTFLLAGSRRLGGAMRIVRYATRLQIFSTANGTSGWVFHLPGARFTLLLTGGSYRGFSGEGSLLTLLARPDAERVGRRLHKQLAWEPTIDPKVLAESLHLPSAEVAGGLAWLASAGRVGFDLAEGRWFHRELPIDTDAILRRNPRLIGAQRLVNSASVKHIGEGWTLPGSRGGRNTVRETDGGLTCTCKWFTDWRQSRGPCKHMLAVILTRAPSE
jgi:hypothetical protein